MVSLQRDQSRTDGPPDGWVRHDFSLIIKALACMAMDFPTAPSISHQRSARYIS
jgi:hypothetical protein